jgi:hypothetical protein
MMVMAISVSLIVFSGMWYARTLVLSNTASGYGSTNPASARDYAGAGGHARKDR